MEELLTIDCKAIVRRLLNKQPHLAVWTDICDIYIDKFENCFHTCLIIDCQFDALASFFIQNINALLEPIASTSPIPVRLIHKDNLIAAYLPLLELSPTNKATGLIMVTTLQQSQAQASNQQAIVESIGLNQIPTSMQDLIIEQVASLGLPVTLDNKGGYKLPQATFNIAWQEIGNAVWRQEFGAIAEPAPITDNGTKAAKPTAPVKAATNRASAKNESPRVLLMREKLKPEDDIVITGRNAVKLTLDNFLAKVSFKHYNREQILESIINQTEHGFKLLEKLYEAYAKRDGIYKVRPQEWAKTKAKIIDECRKLLNPPTQEATETEAQQEAETTAE